MDASKTQQCVMCVVNKFDKNLLREPKEENQRDDYEISLYIYDKKTYRAKIWREHRKHTVEYVNPIASINRAHTAASYITFGSHLFRIGGFGLSSDEVKKLEEEFVARALPQIFADDFAHESAQLRGENSATRTVDIIDLNSEDDLMVAKRGPEMKIPRLWPHLLILQGNLYVAGGSMDDDDARSIEDLVFMEVLNKSAVDWFWEPVPNPPPFCVKNVSERPRRDVITGAVESTGVIIVGFLKYEEFDDEYLFYAYRAATRTWVFCTTFSDITVSRPLKDPLCMRAAVVSGNLMLWLPNRNHFTLLYVMDMKKKELITIDLFKNKLLPEFIAPNNCPILLKLKEGKFCVFWTDLDGPRYFSGPQTYVALRAYTFTLKTGRKNEKLYVKRKRRYISLIPDWKTHSLEEICIADIPYSKRHNKHRWTPFCRGTNGNPFG